jgi:hypothetical protein
MASFLFIIFIGIFIIALIFKFFGRKGYGVLLIGLGILLFGINLALSFLLVIIGIVLTLFL